jgi:hypothetical protein
MHTLAECATLCIVTLVLAWGVFLLALGVFLIVLVGSSGRHFVLDWFGVFTAGVIVVTIWIGHVGNMFNFLM